MANWNLGEQVMIRIYSVHLIPLKDRKIGLFIIGAINKYKFIVSFRI
ncbi:MAG: hypothetical protein R2942_02635 [Ignavibacteria bacterium]